MLVKLMFIVLSVFWLVRPVSAAPSEALREITGTAQIEIVENTNFVANFVTDDDFNGQYTLSLEGEDASLFALSAGQLTFIDPPNFEKPSDESHNNIYTLRVNARDSQANPFAIDLQLLVINENEAPILDITTDYVVAEGKSFSFAVDATDEDGDEFTFDITGDDAALFAVSDDQLVTAEFELDYEQALDQNSDNIYQLTVTATDSQGNVGSSAVTLTVSNRQELGRFEGLSPIVLYEIETTNGLSADLLPGVEWIEPDFQFANQVLSIWGHLPEDSIFLSSNDSTELHVVDETGQVLVQGELVAQITPGKHGKLGEPLEITFNELTSTTDANVILAAIQYSNSANIPAEQRLIYFELVDQNQQVTRLIDSLQFAETTSQVPSLTLDISTVIHVATLTGQNQPDLIVGLENGQFAIHTKDTQLDSVNWLAAANGAMAQFDVGANAVATSADLDNDGDMDIVVGNQSGFLSYFENQSSGGALSFENIIGGDSPVSFVDVGNGARPTLVDIDDDLDVDLYITNDDGELFFYQNNGTATAPSFELTSQDALDLSLLGQQLQLSFADLDTDSDLDLVVGSDLGILTYFKNIGSAKQPMFQANGIDNPFSAFVSNAALTPQFMDMDADQDLDLLIHTSESEFFVMSNDSGVTVNVIKRDNSAPEISPVADINLVSGVPYTIAAVATDLDNDPLSYQWQQTSGEALIIIQQEQANFEFVAPEVTEKSVVVLSLTVSDGRTTSEATYTVNIYPVGTSIPGYHLPTVDLGDTLTVQPTATVNLSAVIADLDGDDLDFTWLQESGVAVTLLDSQTLAPSFVSPDVDKTTTLVFRLVVSDGLFAVSEDINVIVEVEPIESATSERDSKSLVALSWSPMLWSLWVLLLIRVTRRNAKP